MDWKKINVELVLLIIILAFAFFIRVYALSHPPFWIDEAISSMASKMILEKGVPVFDSGAWYGRAYVFHYIQAFFLIFGQTDFFARFPSVIFGMLTIILAYFIGKEYSKSGGIVAALFCSVFYLEVFFSRQARFYQLFQLMFFLSLYLLYKSKEKPKFIYPALICFFITLDTQIAGLVLAPFFIIHILVYNKKYYRLLAILPAIPLVKKFMPVAGLTSDSSQMAVNYASNYLYFARHLRVILFFAVPGAIWAFMKKKRLTLLMVIPSVVMLIGIFSLQTVALRYAYFFCFPLVIYSSLFFSFLYEKIGKVMLITILVLLLFPSNLFFPYTFFNVIVPVDYNYYDFSAPQIDLKNIPQDLRAKLVSGDKLLISYFSSSVEWYLRKPDYVLPFSMDGRGDDEISYNSTNGTVDVYSGAKILQEKPKKPYYLVVDVFSELKLKGRQKENLDNLRKNCSNLYKNRDVNLWECNLDYNKT